jgi:poly[(R)-3-hydroxyalkanoate] polymerase subunit PhaE
MEHDLWRQWEALAALATGSGARLAPTAAIAPFVDAARRFADAARGFYDSKDASAEGSAAASLAFSNFLRDQFTDFVTPPWFGASMIGSLAARAATEAPALGLTREHQQRAQQTVDAFRRLDEAQRKLQRLWSDTLRDAATAFAARLGPPQAAAPSAETLDRLYDTWIDCAEEAYARMAHGEAFCNALADYVNAGSQCRRECAAGFEQWAKFFDLPTRNELNTLARRLRSVEERLHAIERSRAPATATRAARRRTRKAKP